MSTLVPRLWSDMAGWLEDVSPRTGLIRLEDHLTDAEYTVRAELPGLDPEKDVHLSVSHGFLTIRAERKEETQAERREEEKGLGRTEFRYGMFERSGQLPETADADKVRAHYKGGILEITVPLKAQPEPKKIAISKE